MAIRKSTIALVLCAVAVLSAMLIANNNESAKLEADLVAAYSNEPAARGIAQPGEQDRTSLTLEQLDTEGERLNDIEANKPVFGGVSSTALPLFMIADLATHFADHWDKALDGDAASMLEISHIMQNCATVEGFSEDAYEEELTEYVESGLISHTQADEVRSLLSPCYEVLGKMPPLPDGSNMSNSFTTRALIWRDDAVRQGNKLAQLETALLAPSSNFAHKEVADLLEDVVRTGDPRAAMLASMFYANYHHSEGEDFNSIEVLKWDYVGCTLHSLCNQKQLLALLSNDLTPSEIGIIEDFAMGYAERIADDEPFGFSDGWMMEEAHVFNRVDSSSQEGTSENE